MNDSKDNANPTILDASDLPSRRTAPHNEWTKPRSDGGTGLFDTLIPPPPYLDDPFDLDPPSSSDSDSSDAGIQADDVHDAAENEREEIDEQEIYDLISTISDPEHPLSLGQLSVIRLPDIKISRFANYSVVTVLITPTITHCSLATVIGLGVRVRLEQALPPRFRVDVRVKEGTHATGDAVSKQLGDKERVAAALENGTLVGVLDKMLAACV